MSIKNTGSLPDEGGKPTGILVMFQADDLKVFEAIESMVTIIASAAGDTVGCLGPYRLNNAQATVIYGLAGEFDAAYAGENADHVSRLAWLASQQAVTMASLGLVGASHDTQPEFNPPRGRLTVEGNVYLIAMLATAANAAKMTVTEHTRFDRPGDNVPVAVRKTVGAA